MVSSIKITKLQPGKSLVHADNMVKNLIIKNNRSTAKKNCNSFVLYGAIIFPYSQLQYKWIKEFVKINVVHIISFKL